MRSTGIGNDEVFADAAPNFVPCAVLPPDDDVPRPTDLRHPPIAAGTSPAPTATDGLETSDDPLLNHSRPLVRSTVQRIEDSGLHGPPQRNDRQSPRIDTENDAHRWAAGDPAPLAGSPSFSMQVPISQQSVHALDVVFDEDAPRTVTTEIGQSEPAATEQRPNDSHQRRHSRLLSNDGVALRQFLQQAHRVHAVPPDLNDGFANTSRSTDSMHVEPRTDRISAISSRHSRGYFRPSLLD